jgi:hypothetical protein
MEWAFLDAKILFPSLYPMGGLDIDFIRYGV